VPPIVPEISVTVLAFSACLVAPSA
jgi:hypothetical protein